ncbi:MAG: tRNA uridine-5-carboxymethylaminomethyl(34) synthesis enzyme MnmG [Clostridia bacterium]|nr:tRNA uridine-5-carboxymethylaminomethyl(34) synthesis enzyme MnmG [Clostridia bacterium]
MTDAELSNTAVDPVCGRHYDVIVVGAGHAGCEAALASARRGLSTALFTTSLDAVANMPCNPSVGGTGKGHLVFEIDALGGEMGYAADCVTMQSRTLNTGKGAAVRSKRVQADRRRYSSLMKQTLENTENLYLIQGEVTKIVVESSGGTRRIAGVEAEPGGEYTAAAVVISTGTYLGGMTHVGEVVRSSGPDGMLPAASLTSSLAEHGIALQRFKTGTPPRIHSRSIDFSVLEVQPGEEHITPFSVRTDEAALNSIEQIPCHIVYTNEKTHKTILDNIHRSPLFSGQIHGTGPRYCPSIEDKIVRFRDKERHQLFVEPMGETTDEIYLQGFSSSLPADVQYEMLRTLRGFENAEIMRFAYAIEYDCIDPTQLAPTLEFKDIKGLFGAGQFNGSSGYEEAACQGLVAGINASSYVLGASPLVLPRHSSYIGTLIDDLVTKGTEEPYRIMTSRSEYRLLLRQDNAERRLCEFGRAAGLIDDDRYEAYLERCRRIVSEVERCRRTTLPPSDAVNGILTSAGSTPLSTGAKLAELIRRPQIEYDDLAPVDPARPPLSYSERLSVQTEIKYEGYVKRQENDARRFERLEDKKIPEDIDYDAIGGLRTEARQKLAKIRPASLGQASRISGVSPADITVLAICLKARGAGNKDTERENASSSSGTGKE